MSHPEETVPDVDDLSELLELVATNPTHWEHRWVNATFVARPDIALVIYWQFDEDAPYFDVSYRAQTRPARALASFLDSHPHCEVMDWCPGRLLTVRANGATAGTFSDVILAVVAELHGPIDRRISATSGPMKRA